MRGVILRESDILKDVLNGIIDKKPMSSLRILAKHYFNNENSRDEIESKLDKCMKQYYEGYKPSKWKDLIGQMVKSVEKYNTYKMVDIDEIHIMENEWNKIIELDNKQLEKLAFILLIYSKINNIKNPTCDNKINNNFTDILKEASVGSKLSNHEQRLLFNQLYKLEYISIGLSCNSTSIKINYINEDDAIKIPIDNFENVISYYDEFRNDKKYIECKCCKKRVIQNSNNTKYCNKCSKQIKQEQINKLKKHKRNKVKNNVL